MITIVAALIGIAWGAFQAKRMGGNRKDMAQYAAGYGIALALVGLLISVVLARTLA